MSPLDVKAADENRDSLAKMVYARMFDWLVEKINVAIGQDPNAVALVGVLDIYGMISKFCLDFSALQEDTCRHPGQCPISSNYQQSPNDLSILQENF